MNPIYAERINKVDIRFYNPPPGTGSSNVFINLNDVATAFELGEKGRTEIDLSLTRNSPTLRVVYVEGTKMFTIADAERVGRLVEEYLKQGPIIAVRTCAKMLRNAHWSATQSQTVR